LFFQESDVFSLGLIKDYHHLNIKAIYLLIKNYYKFRTSNNEPEPLLSRDFSNRNLINNLSDEIYYLIIKYIKNSLTRNWKKEGYKTHLTNHIS